MRKKEKQELQKALEDKIGELTKTKREINKDNREVE
jgi:hypothetical protein